MNSRHRFLGIALSGAKNQKTAIASMDYYPREQKLFVLELYDRITAREGQCSDQALLEIFDEIKEGVEGIGINASATLPPCTSCTKKHCPLPSKCTVPAVKWMREYSKKSARNGKDLRDFTPYTQRPVELYLVNSVLAQLAEDYRFEIDETLGGNKAPLTARMNFIARHLQKTPFHEVLPKLTVALVAKRLEIPKRVVLAHRKVEEGAEAREIILETLSKKESVFIYERDLRQMSHSLAAFDAFWCAYTAYLIATDQVEPAPKGFPLSSGWTHFPSLDVLEE